jgi:hypothetical protein
METLFSTTANETNKYALKKGKTLDLTVNELKAFIDTLIIMDFHSLPTIRSYW